MVVLQSLFVVRLIVGGMAVLASFRYGTGVYFWRETEKLERPSYQVIAKLANGVEIRRYEPYMIAETTVDGSGFREPTASGFRACAEYIFGKNIKQQQQQQKGWSSLSRWISTGSSSSANIVGENGEKMAMTAPVRVSSSTSSSSSSTTVMGEKMAMTAPVRVSGGTTKQGNTKVSFVIGKKYTKKTAPIPINKNVQLREIPAHTLAVRTFSGPPPKDDRVLKERAIIDSTLANAGLEAKSNTETLVYGYHDPFITPNILRRNEVAVLIDGSL